MMTRILIIILLTLMCAIPAWSAERSWVSDFFRFADNEDDIMVDLPGLELALRSGADPNQLSRIEKGAKSTLGEVVTVCSMSRYTSQTDADCLQAIKALIAAGAKLQSADEDILFAPIAWGRAKMVALLISLGADATTWPRHEIRTNYSPVEYAEKKGYHDIVDLLVAHGATRPRGEDAIQWRLIEAARFDSLDTLKGLVEKGANVNGRNLDNEVAMISVLERGHSICDATRKAIYLLGAGADPNVRASGSFYVGGGTTTPLHTAVFFTSFSFKRKEDPTCGKFLLSELIKRGAHVSSTNSSGQTPLHTAAETNNLFAATLLLKSGAKVMPRDKTGKTPLDFAESWEMIKLLKSHGAREQ